MKLMIVLAVFCGAVAQTQAYGVWQVCHSTRYVFRSSPTTWANAQRDCMAIGGHLAVINNRAEEVLVKSLAGGRDIWIGLSNAQQLGHWLWINSQHLHYTNWCPGEPNNAGGVQKCALTNYSGHKCWDDQQCDRRHAYVCERK